jgi:hypothetical protein
MHIGRPTQEAHAYRPSISRVQESSVANHRPIPAHHQLTTCDVPHCARRPAHAPVAHDRTSGSDGFGRYGICVYLAWRDSFCGENPKATSRQNDRHLAVALNPARRIAATPARSFQNTIWHRTSARRDGLTLVLERGGNGRREASITSACNATVPSPM